MGLSCVVPMCDTNVTPHDTSVTHVHPSFHPHRSTGHAIRERATVITRIAPTFLRFGSFETFKTTDPATGEVGAANVAGLMLVVPVLPRRDGQGGCGVWLVQLQV